MNGAECLLRTLLACDVDLCFMNPGTSEMQFVSALDRVPAMRAVLCLFEGVCSGAADGYARMTGKPAATLLHLGPGLAGALSNLHNARKARSPVVNIVGEHATHHLLYDAPLSADIEAFARPVSGWVRTLPQAAAMGAEARAAVLAAHGPPGQVATLIVPADFSWSEAGEPSCLAAPPARVPPRQEQLTAAAHALRSPACALLLGGRAAGEPALRAAARLRAATGVPVFVNRNASRLTRGRGLPTFERIPYFPEPAQALLAPCQRIVLVESRLPVSFFGYPGMRGELAPEGCRFEVLATEEQDGTAALQQLAAEMGAPSAGAATPPAPSLPADGELLTPAVIGALVAALSPEGAIFSDESVSANEAIYKPLAAAAPHDYLPVTGGSIGQGLPVAVGAALACPDRKVIALEADGSSLYTPQSLWTMAREQLDVVVVILANRRYRILEVETARTGAGALGPRAASMIQLTGPVPDWTALAAAFGVPAVRACSAREFRRAFERSLSERGPSLIEAVIA